MPNILYASFADRDEAIRAAGALLDHGLKNDDLSVISRGVADDLDHYRTKPVVDAERESVETAEEIEAAAKKGLSTTTPQDAGVGAAKGAAIGLGTGLALGLASLFVPGVGLVFGGGALAAALGAAAATTGAGAIAGGVHGYLKDQGVPVEAVDRYSEVVEGGGAILAVTVRQPDTTESEVRELLSKYNTSDVAVYDAL